MYAATSTESPTPGGGGGAVDSTSAAMGGNSYTTDMNAGGSIRSTTDKTVSALIPKS